MPDANADADADTKGSRIIGGRNAPWSLKNTKYQQNILFKNMSGGLSIY